MDFSGRLRYSTVGAARQQDLGHSGDLNCFRRGNRIRGQKKGRDVGICMQVYLIGAKKKNLSTKEPHAYMHNASVAKKRQDTLGVSAKGDFVYLYTNLE